MSPYILLLCVFSLNKSIVVMEFSSKEHCEIAGTAVVEKFQQVDSNDQTDLAYVCVEK